MSQRQSRKGRQPYQKESGNNSSGNESSSKSLIKTRNKEEALNFQRQEASFGAISGGGVSRKSILTNNNPSFQNNFSVADVQADKTTQQVFAQSIKKNKIL